MEIKQQTELRYLPNFKKEAMESLLKAYEQYVKLNNSVRIPGLFVIAMIGAARLLQGKMSKNQLITITLVVMSALILWMFVIAYNLIKQKKTIKNQLEIMANAQDYSFKEVKKEFNSFVKTHYKGPKI